MSDLNATAEQQESDSSTRSDEPEPPGGGVGRRLKAQRDDRKRPVASPGPQPAGSCRARVRMHVDDCDPPLQGWLREHFLRICELAGVRKAQVTLVIVGDEEMATLHARYTGVAGTTDVLTFDHRDDTRQPIESDIVICLDTASREARSRGHETRLEVLLYAVHGLNHLLGGDDHTPKGAAAMHRWEDQMLTRAGFGSVYDAGTAGHDKASTPGKPHGKPKQDKPRQDKSHQDKSQQSKLHQDKLQRGKPERAASRQSRPRKGKPSQSRPGKPGKGCAGQSQGSSADGSSRGSTST